MTLFRGQDLTGARFERASLRDAPLVEAELNRRMPQRAKIRPDDSDGFRQAMVRHVLESSTDEQLAADVTRDEAGWPGMKYFPVKECLCIVLNEEWHHRLYAGRDLDALETSG